MKYLQSVANMAYKECIEFLGIEYTRAIPNPDITPENANIFNTQIDVLINEERYISRDEAQEILFSFNYSGLFS